MGTRSSKRRQQTIEVQTTNQDKDIPPTLNKNSPRKEETKEIKKRTKR